MVLFLVQVFLSLSSDAHVFCRLNDLWEKNSSRTRKRSLSIASCPPSALLLACDSLLLRRRRLPLSLLLLATEADRRDEKRNPHANEWTGWTVARSTLVPHSPAASSLLHLCCCCCRKFIGSSPSSSTSCLSLSSGPSASVFSHPLRVLLLPSCSFF